MKDYYEILGVPKNASKQEIEERYQFLSQAFHPDKFSDPAQKEKAEKDFAAIDEAYKVLSSDKKRAKYDQQTAAEPPAPVAPVMSEMSPEPQVKVKNRTWIYIVGGVVILLLIVGAGFAGKYLPFEKLFGGNPTAQVAAEPTNALTPASTAVKEIVGAKPGECQVAPSIFPPEKGAEWQTYAPISASDYVKGPENAVMTIFEYSDFT
jgi:curved DNA-binding protein CbpA